MEKFKAFIPVDIIEKGEKGKDGLPEKLLISGVASSMKSGKKDKDGHRLNVAGFDYQPFLKGGFFNLEHKGREDYTNIVGEPTNAYVKDGEFHVEGELYKDNPKAVGIYQLGQILKKSGSTRKIGYSIEGQVAEKNPLDPSDIRRSIITGVALTISPKCDGTEALFKGGEVIEYELQKDSDFLIDITDENGVRITVDKNLEIVKGGEGSKGGKVIGHTKSGNPIYESFNHPSHSNFSSQDHKDASRAHEKKYNSHYKKKDQTSDSSERSYHAVQEEHHQIQMQKHHEASSEVQKAMEAGSITGTETHGQNLTQQPLKQESVAGTEGKKKKKKKAIISDVTEMTKSDVLQYLDDLDISDEEKEEVFELAMDIEKGGAGSRGGKVVGQTKSGKPIYLRDRTDWANGPSLQTSRKRFKSDHENFTPEEHREAAEWHFKQQDKHKPGSSEDVNHFSHGDSHMLEAKRKEKSENISKAEILTSLLSDHNLDIESAKTVYRLAEAIEKAEGSRGGKVIGHTKSGKAIYETHGGSEGYTSQDHKDAADTHEKRQGKAFDAKNYIMQKHHEKMSKYHNAMAKEK